MDHGDDTNISPTQGSTTPVVDVRNMGNPYRGGSLRNRQSRRGEQKAAESGELGVHSEDAGAVNRQYNESLK